MGIGAWWHWLVVLLIVVLVFGTKKLKNIGSDVGGAVKNFKDAMGDASSGKESEEENVIEQIEADASPKKASAKPKSNSTPK